MKIDIDHDIAAKRADLDMCSAAQAARKSELDQHNAAKADKQRQIDALQAEISELRTRTPAFEHAVTAMDRTVNECEEVLLEAINIRDFASPAIQLNAADPIGNNDEIVALVDALRERVPSEFDWPINKPYRLHPLTARALALLPPPNDLDRRARYVPGWAAKRKVFIRQSLPQQAA
jgi:hypothetical protein